MSNLDGPKIPTLANDSPSIPQLKEHERDFSSFEEAKEEFQQSLKMASNPEIPRLQELPDRQPYLSQPDDPRKRQEESHRFSERQPERIPELKSEDYLDLALKESGLAEGSYEKPDKERKDIRSEFQKKEETLPEIPSSADGEAPIGDLEKSDPYPIPQTDTLERESFPAIEGEGLSTESAPMPTLDDYTAPSSLDSLFSDSSGDSLGQLIQSIDSLAASLASQEQPSGDYPPAPYSQAFNQPHRHTDFVMGGG